MSGWNATSSQSNAPSGFRGKIAQFEVALPSKEVEEPAITTPTQTSASNVPSWQPPRRTKPAAESDFQSHLRTIEMLTSKENRGFETTKTNEHRPNVARKPAVPQKSAGSNLPDKSTKSVHHKGIADGPSMVQNKELKQNLSKIIASTIASTGSQPSKIGGTSRSPPSPNPVPQPPSVLPKQKISQTINNLPPTISGSSPPKCLAENPKTSSDRSNQIEQKLPKAHHKATRNPSDLSQSSGTLSSTCDDRTDCSESPTSKRDGSQQHKPLPNVPLPPVPKPPGEDKSIQHTKGNAVPKVGSKHTLHAMSSVTKKTTHQDHSHETGSNGSKYRRLPFPENIPAKPPKKPPKLPIPIDLEKYQTPRLDKKTNAERPAARPVSLIPEWTAEEEECVTDEEEDYEVCVDDRPINGLHLYVNGRHFKSGKAENIRNSNTGEEIASDDEDLYDEVG